MTVTRVHCHWWTWADLTHSGAWKEWTRGLQHLRALWSSRRSLLHARRSTSQARKDLTSTLGERASPALFLSADVPFDLNIFLSSPVTCLLTVLIDYYVLVVQSLKSCPTL